MVFRTDTVVFLTYKVAFGTNIVVSGTKTDEFATIAVVFGTDTVLF